MNFEDENRIIRFHNEPKDSLDMVIIGSSDVYTGYSAALAYQETGIKSYPYTLSGSTCLVWETMIRDILRTQSPDVILIETFGACYSDKHLSGTSPETYKLFDTLPISIFKLRKSIEVADYFDDTDALSLFMPFIKYHEKYGLYPSNLKHRLYLQRQKRTPLKGIHNTASIFEIGNMHIDLSEEDRTKELDTISQKSLYDFMEYCKTIDSEVVFINFPTLAKKEGSYMHKKCLRANKVGEIVRENGFDYINLQRMTREIGIDESRDFSDIGHSNVYGQTKITKSICKILKEKYGLPRAGKHITPDNDREWKESADFYKHYYALSDQKIKSGIEAVYADNEETLEKVRKKMKGKANERLY